ncbi:Guanine nucleotide binding protein (G protein), beta polypeptide 1-like [Linderina macrospora]|uniref:Guanine nucleotide binding protein (G protein), beta polypeptide 1-like n=1 Tax=Linderina macrospora TaxID=4868 RepID=A0ACC1IYU6_9FUNG|nr:Guanine nucleotide binding protein (G protein), beta polypeptide 1-like [Linderina macrospora]
MNFCTFSHIQHQDTTWVAGVEQGKEGNIFFYNIATATKFVVDVSSISHTDIGTREDAPMCLKLVPVNDNTDALGLLVGYESTKLQLYSVNLSGDKHAAVLKCSQKTAHSESIMSIDYDSDEKAIYTCSADNKVCRYTIDAAGFHAAQEPGILRHGGSAEIRFFSSPKLVAVAGWDYAVHLLDSDLKLRGEARFHRASVTSVDMSTLARGNAESISNEVARARWNGRAQWLVVASQDHRISLWNVQDLL